MTKAYFIAYLTVIFSYLILEMVWLGLVAKNSYQTSLAGFLRENYVVWPWVTFYILYSFAVVFLIIHPYSGQASVIPVIIAGATFGLAAYGAYNLTNYAILKDWPLAITLKDWAWGTFVTTTISVTGWQAFRLVH